MDYQMKKVKFRKSGRRFIKVIMSATDQTEMQIPLAFCKKLETIESKEEAILTSSEGLWRVKIGKCKKGSSFYFEEGWEDFGEHHKLSIGDFVLFEHKGDFHFDVFVFDPTTCQKEFTTTTTGKRKNAESIKRRMSSAKKSPDVAEASSACKNPHFIGTVRKKNGTPYMNIPMNFVISNDIGKVETVSLRDSSQRLWYVKINSCINGGNDLRTNMYTMTQGWTEFYDAYELEEGDVCLFELDCNYIQSTSYEKTEAIMDVIVFKTTERRMPSGIILPPEVAEASSACKNPHFIGTIHKNHDIRYIMHIPKTFINDIGNVKCVSLRDSSQMIWSVNLSSRKNSGNIRTHMGGQGWSKFYDAHELEEGDVCLFELDSNCTQSTSSEDTTVILDVIIFSSSI